MVNEVEAANCDLVGGGLFWSLNARLNNNSLIIDSIHLIMRCRHIRFDYANREQSQRLTERQRHPHHRTHPISDDLVGTVKKTPGSQPSHFVRLFTVVDYRSLRRFIFLFQVSNSLTRRFHARNSNVGEVFPTRQY